MHISQILIVTKFVILSKNPDLYQKYLDDIYKVINDDYFNGEFNCKIFDPIFTKDASKISLNDWEENAKKLLKEYEI